MSEVRLTILIATIGRPSLERMLKSVARQADPSLDEILLVGDLQGISDAIGRLWTAWPTGLIRIIPFVRGGNWGHAERNFAMPLARGTHIVHGDDDDAFTPGALTAIRSVCATAPGPVMFKMRDFTGEIIWREKAVAFANHGTPQFVIPNDPERFGVFTNRHGGDFDFVQSTLAKYPPGVLVWNDAVIYACREYAEVTA